MARTIQIGAGSQSNPTSTVHTSPSGSPAKKGCGCGRK